MKHAFSATISKASLATALGHIKRIVEKRNTIPILANVLLEAKGDEITVRGTDLDLEATESVLATIAGPGSITVPAHLLYDIVCKLPDGADIALTMEKDDTQLTIRSGRSRFRLQTLPAEDFPTLESGEFPNVFTMAAPALQHMLGSCTFAISTEETRYYLNGIHLHTILDGNALNMRAVATDGHRLARLETMGPAGTAEMAGVILPRKAVNEVLKLLEDASTVTVSVSKAKMRFEIGKVVLTTKLIDGTFPDYQRVIPSGNDKVLRIGRDILSNAVDRVATMSSSGRAMKLSLSEGRITLSVINPDAGSSVEELDADWTGPLLEIGFNAKYLLDILANIDGDTVTAKFSDPGSPALFGGENPDGLYVLMPLRV